ncbi:MAG: hypothetical protein Q9217_000606 [Psora testacea]
MPNTGKPSGACATCKQRHVKPWLTRETLLVCPGYTEGLDLVLRNQNETAKAGVGRRQKQRSRTRGPGTLASKTNCPAKCLPELEEAHSLCFFISCWADYSPDPQSDRDFVGLLPLLYPRAKTGSPLTLCVAAISHLVFNKFEHKIQKPETLLQVRETYGKALTATRISLQDPIASLADETLMAVCLLGWYEACVGAFKAKISSPQHFEGAAALIQQRQGFLMNDITKRMLVGVRSNLAYRAIESASPIDVTMEVWHEPDNFTHTPASLLDLLTAGAANILARARRFPNEVRRTDGIDKVKTEDSWILSTAKAADAELAMWQDVIPPNWTPIPVSRDHVPNEVIEAGLYGQTCDVYQDIITCSTWNDWRTARLKVLGLIARCTISEERANAINTIQELVDAICASIPFCLGSRTTPASLHAADIIYPTIPGQKTCKLHYLTAAARGGWYLFAPMKQVMAVGLYLRQGQMMWMDSQLQRLATIYDIIPET